MLTSYISEAYIWSEKENKASKAGLSAAVVQLAVALYVGSERAYVINAIAQVKTYIRHSSRIVPPR